VGASTFDSFATGTLAAADPDGSWQSASYDRRIQLAAEHLSGASELPILDLVRHVLIDEMQDLVGARADLVKALLARVRGGFTVFGDPAQAIYDYQDVSATARTTTSALYDWLGVAFRDSLIRQGLTTDYRATTEQIRGIATIGETLRSVNPDQTSIRNDIRTVLLGLPVATPGSAKRVLTDATSRCSVLVRTNGEALWLSRTLNERGIRHQLQRRGDDKAAAGWLSEVVAGLGLRASRSQLRDRLVPVADREDLAPDACLRLLRLIDPRRGDEYDLRRIADRVRLGDIPEELNSTTQQNVVVSTIHRAKGLEFDCVMLLGELPESRNADQGLENRIAYVALSRARSELWHLDAQAADGLRVDQASQRWVRKGFGPNAWKVYDIEISGGDVDALHPAGAWLIDSDVLETQNYIREAVRPGDLVRLVLTPVDDATEQAHYAVIHEGRPVGVTSEAFATVLARATGRGSSGRWPTAIEGVRVELVDTVAGHESVGREAGLGGHGMWARVRVSGLGVLVFGEGN
jgi:hypothetical protein